MGAGVCLWQFLRCGIAGTEGVCDFNFDALHRGPPLPHSLTKSDLSVFSQSDGWAVYLICICLIMRKSEHLSTCPRDI